ncbi:MAG: hypothetical protein J6U68_03515 [Clostridia bacterium]|nr:hypothetical protein [Clostridia bacterium]
MNSAENNANLLNGGEITTLLKRYLCVCHSEQNRDSTENEKKKTKKDTVFPNLAGFCRFIGVGTSELEAYGKSNPSEYERVLTVLEDEALNSGVSPALVSAYLKKRLGYDGAKPQENASQLEIKFEHDIFEDGG